MHEKEGNGLSLLDQQGAERSLLGLLPEDWSGPPAPPLTIRHRLPSSTVEASYNYNGHRAHPAIDPKTLLLSSAM
jgi:hypothetical protein